MQNKKGLTIIILIAAMIIFTMLLFFISQRQEPAAPPAGGSLVSGERPLQEALLVIPQDEAGDINEYEIIDIYEYEKIGYEIIEINESDEYPVYYEIIYEYTEEEFTPVFASEPLPDHIIDFIYGRSFRSYAPFDLCFLTYLTISYVNFEGEDRIGHMIVAAEIGDEVLEIFQEIYESRFPIYSIKLIDYFDALDYHSLAANNSSAFNFRYIAGTNRLSRHAFGMAIDINPIQNPYIRDGTIWPAAGEAYTNRSYARPGMIVPGNVVYNAFISRGWTWGGNWTRPRDYHHFERN